MMKVMAWSAGGHDESRARLLTFVVLMIKKWRSAGIAKNIPASHNNFISLIRA